MEVGAHRILPGPLLPSGDRRDDPKALAIYALSLSRCLTTAYEERSKKPEKLIARILALSTDPGDWVLDGFLGSGTTAAVALKMGRKWVGIERGAHVDTMCLPRLRRVVDGTDKAGVTRAFDWTGGGGFDVWT